MAWRVVAALVATLSCACSTAPIVLPATFDDRGITRRAAVPTGCPVQLASVNDQRHDPVSLGRVGPQEVRADDFVAWLRGGMAARLGVARAGDAAPVTVEADILQAYVRSVAVSKSVDIVARVRFARDGVTLGESVYRGSTTATNWSGSDEEIRGAFARALASLTDQVRAGAVAHCGTPPPQGAGT